MTVQHNHKNSPAPLPQKAIGDYLFSIAAGDGPVVPGRRELILEHLAAWLLDEWRHEQDAGCAPAPTSSSSPRGCST